MKFKRILASAMALVMVASSLLVAPVNADAAETADTSTGLTGYYTFDETLMNSVSGSYAKLHGGAGDTWNGGPTITEAVYADGKNGNAYSFAGDATVKGDGLELDVKTGEEFTVGMWVNTAQKTNYQSIVFIDYDFDSFINVGTNFNDYASGALALYGGWGNLAAWLDKNDTDSISTVKDIALNTWTYVTLTGTEDGTFSLYYDGELLANTTIADYDGRYSDQYIFLGINFWDASYKGLMDEVTVYDRALTATDVAALYADNGVPADYVLGGQYNNDTMESGSTEITVGAGETYYFEYYTPSLGDYTVNVEGNTGFNVGVYTDPMMPMPTVTADTDGAVSQAVTTSMMAWSVRFFVQNTTDEEQTYAVSVDVATAAGGEESTGSGTQDDPAELVIGTTQNTTVAGSWDLYFYGCTVEEAGSLTLTMDPSCEYWLYSLYVNGQSVTQYEQMMSAYGDSNTFSVDVAAGDEILLGVNLTDSNGTAITGEVSFTTELGEASGGEGDEGEEGGEGDEGGEAAGTFDDPKPIIMGTNTSVHELYQYVYYTYTATESGSLTISMKTDESTNGWAFDGYYNDYEYFASALSSANEDSALTTVALNAGDVVTMTVWTQDEGPGTVVFNAFFMAGEGRVEGKEEFVMGDTTLNLGENNVTLDPSADTTGFEFTPEETGTYKFEVTGDLLLGDWNASYYPLDMTVNKTNTLEATVTSVGQSILVGVTGEGDCTITVTKVTSELPQEPTNTEIMYENKVDPMEFELPDDVEIAYVDVTDGEVETAVLGKDGFYHLNTEDGPILFVDLNSNILSLIQAYGYGQVKVAVVNEDGSYTTTNYYDAITEYYNTGMFCVLTEDLITIYKELGNDKGWYDPEKPLGNYIFQNVTVDEATGEVNYENIPCDENAWMFACAYVDAEAVTAEDQTWTQESGKDVVVTLDTAFDNFGTLYVDGKVVAAENYTVAEGSIVLTLKAAYLDTLEVGTYTVEVLYKNANVTLFDLTVEEAAAEEPEVPAKGDVSDMVGYMVVLMGAALVVVAIAAKKRFA